MGCVRETADECGRDTHCWRPECSWTHRQKHGQTDTHTQKWKQYIHQFHSFHLADRPIIIIIIRKSARRASPPPGAENTARAPQFRPPALTAGGRMGTNERKHEQTQQPANKQTRRIAISRGVGIIFVIIIIIVIISPTSTKPQAWKLTSITGW